MSDWEDQVPDLDGEADPGKEADEPSSETDAPEPYFSSMLEFFEGWLRPMYRRSTMGDRRDWCPEWWQHEEAVSRIDALWRAWETLRLDPGTGLSVWWRDHADHHMAALLDPDGPFKHCGDDGHQDDAPPMLMHTAPPPELFAIDDGAPAAVDLGDLDGCGRPNVVVATAARQPIARPEAGRSL